MEYKQEVNKVLEKLGKVLDLSDIKLDINNHCLILFDDKIVLNLELDEDQGILIIYSYISVVPFVAKELIVEILLESNFFWKALRGATFAIDKQTQTIVLQQKFQLPLKESENFEDILSVFVDVVEAWMKRIDEICTEAETLMDEERIVMENKKIEKEYGSWKF